MRWSTYRVKGGPWHAEAGRSLAGCSAAEHPLPEDHPPRDWKSIPTLEVEPRPIGGFGSEILSLRSLSSADARRSFRGYADPPRQSSLLFAPRFFLSSTSSPRTFGHLNRARSPFFPASFSFAHLLSR